MKHWVTVNEPFTVVRDGYIIGHKAPGRCSSFTNPNCTGGDGATEPYIVGHNFLLAHGAAVKIYRERYQVCLLCFTYTLVTCFLLCLIYVLAPALFLSRTTLKNRNAHKNRAAQPIETLILVSKFFESYIHRLQIRYFYKNS